MDKENLNPHKKNWILHKNIQELYNKLKKGTQEMVECCKTLGQSLTRNGQKLYEKWKKAVEDKPKVVQEIVTSRKTLELNCTGNSEIL